MDLLEARPASGVGWQRGISGCTEYFVLDEYGRRGRTIILPYLLAEKPVTLYSASHPNRAGMIGYGYLFYVLLQYGSPNDFYY